MIENLALRIVMPVRDVNSLLCSFLYFAQPRFSYAPLYLQIISAEIYKYLKGARVDNKIYICIGSRRKFLTVLS